MTVKSKLNVKVLTDAKGKKTGVLLRIKDFEKLMGELEDLKDISTVYERMSKSSRSIPYEKIREELFNNDATLDKKKLLKKG